MTSHMGLVVARPGLVRDGLQAVLSAVPGVHALEPADSAASALERLESHSVCLAILDSSLPEDELRTTLGAIKETMAERVVHRNCRQPAARSRYAGCRR